MTTLADDWGLGDWVMMMRTSLDVHTTYMQRTGKRLWMFIQWSCHLLENVSGRVPVTGLRTELVFERGGGDGGVRGGHGRQHRRRRPRPEGCPPTQLFRSFAPPVPDRCLHSLSLCFSSLANSSFYHGTLKCSGVSQCHHGERRKA